MNDDKMVVLPPEMIFRTLKPKFYTHDGEICLNRFISNEELKFMLFPYKINSSTLKSFRTVPFTHQRQIKKDLINVVGSERYDRIYINQVEGHTRLIDLFSRVYKLENGDVKSLYELIYVEMFDDDDTRKIDLNEPKIYLSDTFTANAIYFGQKVLSDNEKLDILKHYAPYGDGLGLYHYLMYMSITEDVLIII